VPYTVRHSNTRATANHHHRYYRTCARDGAGLGQVRGEGRLALPAEVDILKHALQLRRVVRAALLYSKQVQVGVRGCKQGGALLCRVNKRWQKSWRVLRWRLHHQLCHNTTGKQHIQRREWHRRMLMKAHTGTQIITYHFEFGEHALLYVEVRRLACCTSDWNRQQRQ
jgi:hypothetical protein